MNRCPTTSFTRTLLAGCAAVLLWTALPTAAQVQPGLGVTRNFPPSALRGVLTIDTVAQATLNNRPIRLAPGMRLFSPQNTLVMAHSVIGQTFKVNYVIENSTGMLLTAWILTEKEAAQPRKGSDAVHFNFRTESANK
ncbi:MAG: hypothetical protein QM569_05190 [Acidovorax sp.]|uniref:hypothetical protein n=1 Tax=Acidovorax sp. TaxID=1872122 RepID=UPI0039E3BE2D